MIVTYLQNLYLIQKPSCKRDQECCLQKPTLKTYRLKVEGWRKIHHANTNKKKAGTTILILDKVYFRARKMIRNKEGHLHNNKQVHSLGRYNNPHCICPYQQISKTEQHHQSTVSN